jgi:uncharacterized membrane protein
MRRVTAFLTILIASLIALVALTAIGFAIFSNAASNQQASNWMSQMWSGNGGMMGQNPTGNTTQASSNSLLPYFGAAFAVMIGETVVGIVGVSYYLLYPQMKFGATQPPTAPASQLSQNSGVAYESVTKTLTEKDRKIITVLNAHEGKYLQKYIKNETGFSRLQTHRIIARLADRGIVSLEKTGNTNQVYLANWLQQKQ